MELTKEVKNLTDSLTESKKISTHLQEQLVLDTDNLKRKLLEEKKILKSEYDSKLKNVTESKDEEIKQLVVQSKSKRTNEETTTTRTTQAPHDDKTMIKKNRKIKK